MQNTIAHRIYDFLKQFPPFSFMAKEDLLNICTQATVIYIDKEDVLFERDAVYKDRFYIVQQGAVRLSRPSGDQIKVVDICDEGDLFGLKVTSEDTYRTTATANEETILYTLPVVEFSAFAKANKTISNYLIATFASNIKDPYTLQKSGALFTEYEPEKGGDLLGFEQARYSTDIISCSPTTSIKKAAQLMQEHQIGCLVVTINNIPQGVLTNRELRNAIANDILKEETTVTDVMVNDVVCAGVKVTVAESQLLLLKNGISHLVITQDSTQQTEVVGILSKHDIVVAYGHSPGELIKEIKRAPKTKILRLAWEKAMILLKRYLDQNLPLSHILSVFAPLKDALIQRAMELSLRKMKESPPVPFAWLSLGSQGREEQLLYTDQDNAIIYTDVPKNQSIAIKSYFLKLANRMNKRLHKIGYDYCPADMMASNPLYCLSLSEWQHQFATWITSPSPESMLLSGIFFDYRFVYGDKKLAEQLTADIFSRLQESSVFFRFMAKDALKNPPPVSFFRNFLVESNGEHKDEFDIKNRAMAPLIGAARVLSLYHNERGIHNTTARFEKLAVIEPNNSELYESCAYAFKALLKFRVKQGLENGTSGRFITLANLSKSERLKLKRCFKPLRDVQELIQVRFQTQNLS
ncbi:DUF294 nucleotidyltransferase-like domain-containing protein [Dokdonia sp. Hel_I_53]|uniref:DUF294 nucleotidyltransferase-like domain-containing protein n=1 Tax=Dokdonia sp. Hel_I_53 TaxID=1566287 RepID=UPI00119BA402|nr:DUF294 nucleotidyltransferase-like domain-containing protein [Dokdonia sp. Hel_I_53]TVZ52459.1 CBS domain-containing protein [Dokdonia sp. Hel_I_53]